MANPTSQTPNTKVQTPEKLQCSSSKPPTSLQELEFGHWDFFGAWILVFGVFIPVFGAWFLVCLFMSERLDWIDATGSVGRQQTSYPHCTRQKKTDARKHPRLRLDHIVEQSLNYRIHEAHACDDPQEQTCDYGCHSLDSHQRQEARDRRAKRQSNSEFTSPLSHRIRHRAVDADDGQDQCQEG